MCWLELLSTGYATYRGVSRWPLTTISRERERAEWDLLRDYCRQERQAILRLRRRRLVKARKTGRGLEILLTKQGEVEALRHAIIRTTKELDHGLWCYVSFDVPRLANAQRERLRRFLRRAGFSLVHQSLYRSSKDVTHLLRQLIQQSQTKKAVFVFVGQDQSQM